MSDPDIYAIRRRARRTQEEFADALAFRQTRCEVGSNIENGRPVQLARCCD